MTTYVSYTYLDALTGETFNQNTSRGGPVAPAGCVFDFEAESLRPTPTPTFYGTTTGRTDIPGILAKLTKAEFDAAKAAEMAARDRIRVEAASVTVNTERDRRINAGVTFRGVQYQSDAVSRERIDKSRGSAIAAILGGAQEGDLRWTGLPVDFFWIAMDDTRTPMDAQTMVMLGNTAAAREGVLIVAANDLKKRIAAGETIANIADDALWP